jgi:hypothetical protein
MKLLHTLLLGVALLTGTLAHAQQWKKIIDERKPTLE